MTATRETNRLGGTLHAATTILRVAFRSSPRQTVLVTALTVTVAVCGTLQPVWLGLLVTSILNDDRRLALSMAAAIGLTASAFVVLDWVRFHAAQSLQERASLYLDERMARMSMEIPGLQHHEVVEFQDRMSTLREQRVFLGQSLMSTLGGINLAIRGVGVLGLLTFVNPILLLLPISGIGLIACIRKADRMRDRSLTRTAAQARRAQHLFDLVTSPQAAKELHIFRLRDRMLGHHDALMRAVDSERRRAMVRGAGIQVIGWVIFVAGYAAGITWIARLALRNEISTGDVAMTLGLATQVYGLLQGGLAMIAWMLLGLGAVRHYLWLKDYADTANCQPAPTDRAPVPTRLRSGIEFRRVSFRYPDTDINVLSDADVHLPAGSTVAIVGDNGAGKSTLVKLLCRFYEPSSGSILVDGADLASFDVDQWRTRLAAAFQDFARLEFTVRESVGVGDLPHLDSPRKVDTALARAGAPSFAASLQRGLETQLGSRWDGGVELSGGQWQKLALGRSLMREDPLVLILDEPTANLDPQAEHELFRRQVAAAQRASKDTGTITLLVSHRFSTVRMADLIVVVDGGRIREVGRHEQLHAAGGLYAELYDLQARTYA